MRARWPDLLLTAAFATVACRSAADDVRVRIADLEDRRVARPGVWEGYLTRGDEEVRARAALAVGRIREPALAPALHRALAVEPIEAVKSAQLFALGQIGDGESLSVLLSALGSQSPELRAAAAEAIGKLHVPQVAPNLVARLVDPAPAVRGATLLALARLVGRRSSAPGELVRAGLDPDSATVFLQAAPTLLDDADGEVRWRCAYALAEIEIEGRADLLRRAAHSDEPLVRFFAASGLARLAASRAIAPEDLLPLLRDPDRQIAASAALGLAKVGGVEALPELAQAAGAEGPAAFHLRRAAIAALGELHRRKVADPDRLIEHAVTKSLTDPSLSVRGEALRVQAATFTTSTGEPRIGDAVAMAAPGRDRQERVAAVRALGAAPLDAVLAKLIELATDPDAYVSSEALAALAGLAPAADRSLPEIGAQRERLLGVARRGAGVADFAVAASALDLLKKVGTKDDLARVDATFRRMQGFEASEARVTAVHCAAAIAGKEAIGLLRNARRDPSPAVVAAAEEEWRKLALPAEPPPAREREGVPGSDEDEGGPPSSIELEPGLDFLSSAPNPKIALHFAKGDVVLELLREAAPHHVKMLLTRVRSGRCAGLPIHRVVTGFVVQGLDPRGDGWGTGGLFLRDEIQRVRYERGAVGMPNAGPDSGGCQVFVTMYPTPHLDGRYTVFGRVVAGMEVVDSLDVGDVCSKAEVLR